jgi:hypothetical protein
VAGFRPFSSAVALLASLALCRAAEAQEPQSQPAPNAEAAAPEIHGVLANSQRVFDRLQVALNLTTAAEQKQFKILKEYIEVFLPGVDPKKPVRMDILTGGEDTTYRLYVPVDDFKLFWKKNLDPLGIPVKSYRAQPGVYRLGGGKNDAFDGDMLHDPMQREGYAIIWERPAGQKQAKLPPAEAQVPLTPVQDLLNAGYDAALRLRNKPEGVEVRHQHYAGNRDEILGKLKRDTEESVSDFNLRKFFAGIQFDESERLYAEAKEFVAGLTVSPKPEEAVGKLRLEPLPGTSLAGSVALIGQQPSRFAGVAVGEKAASTGRINFPLDPFRQKNALELVQKMRENRLEKLGAETGVTDEQREARKQMANLFVDLVSAGINAGVADGFLEMTKEESGVYTMTGGMKVPDGAAWIPLLELVPKTGRASEVKTNTGEQNGVALHELTLAKEEHASYFELFGDGRLLAATGPDTIWYAAGPKADETLKRAIEQAAQPGQPNPTFLSFRGELLPAVQVVDRRLGKKGQDKYRDMAIEAFQNGEGRLNATLTRNGDAIDGEMSLDRGVLRAIGKGLADFSKENLE